MLKLYVTPFTSPHAAEAHVLASILLIGADGSLRNSRALLLATLNIPVREVSEFSDVCALQGGTCFSLVAIGLLPSQRETAKIAAYVRRQWPAAKILLLGKLEDDFDDPLYDDIVDPCYNPTALIEASKRLLMA